MRGVLSRSLVPLTAALVAATGVCGCKDGGAAGQDTDTGSDSGDPACSAGDTFDEADCPDAYPDWSCVVYVDGASASSGDGFSWGAAKRTVQEGVDLARCGVQRTSLCEQWQVWVRAGRYHVHQGCREHTVRLRESVRLYGGFEGSESALGQRDPQAFETILDGAAAADGKQRVYHVVTADNSSRLDGVTVVGGRADDPAGASDALGGGMLVQGRSDVVLDGCVFRDNAASSGGALFAGDSQLTIRGCLFENNRAFRISDDYSFNAYGGAISAQASSLAIEGSVFKNNSVEEDPQAVGASASWGGGAILAMGMSHFTVDDSRFENNQVLGGAGTGSQQVAGAIWIYDSTGTTAVTGSVFQHNSAADQGGALFLMLLESASLTGNVFRENEAKSGGAVQLYGCSSVVIAGGEFGDNAAGYCGGGLVADLGSAVEVAGTTFAGNEAALFGGAIAVWGGSGLGIAGATFLENQAGDYGGAVLASEGSLEVSDTLFAGNSVTGDPPDGGFGGALDVSDSTASLLGVVFAGNVAAVGGGALSAMSVDSLVIDRCRFEHNAADVEGGAVYASDAQSQIQASVFLGNAAAAGGALYLTALEQTMPADIVLNGVTLAGNYASGDGGAIHADRGAIAVRNSILWDNTSNPVTWVPGAAEVEVSWSDVQGGWPGAGNIDAEPLFVDAAQGDLRLQPGSPCIDAANGETATEFDIEGLARWDDPAAANTGLGPPWADIGAHERHPRAR